MDLDRFWAEAGHRTQQTWNRQLALMLQPESLREFDAHPEFPEVFRLYTQGDQYRGMVWAVCGALSSTSKTR